MRTSTLRIAAKRTGDVCLIVVAALPFALFATRSLGQVHPTPHAPLSIHPIVPPTLCTNHATPPIIHSAQVAAPAAITQTSGPPSSWDPSSGRLEWGGVDYLSGKGIILKIVTDSCTQIQNVHAGPYTLTPADSFQGAEPQSYFFSSVDTQNDSLGHGYQITVGYPTITDGSSETLSVTFVRSGGTATSTYSLPLVHVANVWPASSDTPVGTSLTELQNQFAHTAYQFFGGAANSGYLTQGKSRTRIYDYNAADSGLSMDTLGTWIALTFKAGQACHPRLLAQGEFAIDTSKTAGFSVNWVNPATLTTNSACVTILEALKGALHDLLFGNFVGPGGLSSPQGTLTGLITAGLPDPSSYELFLDGTRTYGTDDSGELLLNLTLLVPSVEITVPYQSLGVASSPMRFPPGQLIGLFASGLGMTDSAAGAFPWRPRLSSGPHGVPLGLPDAPGVLSVARSSGLVDGSAAVGQLLAKFQMSGPEGDRVLQDFQYSNGCTLTVPQQSRFTSPNVIFGVNDTSQDSARLQAQGAPGYHIRITFGFGAGPCAQPQAHLLQPSR